ncbi:MAG: hypothetical protein ACRYF0_07805 [Janthinobacterium lividum]
MKKLYCLLVVASLLYLACSCATQQRIPAALDARLDSALTTSGVPPLRKLKFTGPVTFQIGGTGNVATAIAKTKAPVASAPHATASAVKTWAGPPWYVYLVGGLLLALGGFLLRGRLKIPVPF